MKKIILFFTLVFFVVTSFSQKDSKFTNFYFDIRFGDQYNVSVVAKNVVSKYDFAKLGIEIYNNTDNYILFLKDKCKFVISGQSYFPKPLKKGKIIIPKKKQVFTVQVDGETKYLVNDFDFKPGGIYTFPAEEHIASIEAFHLPPNKNQIEAGSFKINMLKLKKITKETIVKFTCIYSGDKIAVISPSYCVLRTKDGKEWATSKSNIKPTILQKNESTTFTLVFNIPGKIVDMQFAEIDIVWKKTFNESELTELNFDIQNTKIDITKTAKNN